MTHCVIRCGRYKAELISTGLLKLVNTLVQFAPSLIVARILKFIGQGGKATQCSAVSANLLSRLSIIASPAVQNAIAQLVSVFCHEGFQLSLLLFITLSCKTAIENQYFDAVSRLSSEVRGTLSTAVYRKALKLSPASRANNTVHCICLHPVACGLKMKILTSFACQR